MPAAPTQPERFPPTVGDPEAYLASWKVLYTNRRAVRSRWPRIWSLPLRKRASDLVRDCAAASGRPRVLEVGAGDRRLADQLRQVAPDLEYASADPDPGGAHDFPSVAAAPEGWDVIACLEVLEHLALPDALALLQQIHGRLRPGGALCLSTPNVFAPGQYLRDATHRTPWCYDELGGALLAAGFPGPGLSLFRIYNDSWPRRVLHRVLAYPLHRTLGVDFAPGVGAVARREGSA